MRYSRLISSLVDECVAASLGGYDVEDAIGHLDAGGDIIREMLIKLVCDPRVKSTVRPAHWWEDAAQDKLEDLALKMMRTDDLSREEAGKMVEQFLSDYFFTMIQKVSSPPLHNPGACGKDILGNDGDDEGEENGGGAEGAEEADKAADLEEALKDLKEGGGDFTREEEQNVEIQYMRSIPSSLVRLARLIGRSGTANMNSSGHFLTAAKSDIAGITVGDDLSNLLPSEVALLSCGATHDIFLRNYAEKRLQVFASASSGGESRVSHRNGPVIICLDTSASMKGRPARIAAALTIAVAIVAQRRHRRVLVIKYSDGHTMFTLKNLRKQRRDLMKYLSVFNGCGNDEDSMFRWLFEEVIPQQEDFSSADVLCVSDFGWSPVTPETYAMMNDYKSRGTVFYGLDPSGEGLADFRVPDFMNVEGGGVFPPDIIDSMWVWHEKTNECIEEKLK